MALVDHLKELRYRVTVACVAIIVAAIGSAFFYRHVMAVVTSPYYRARDMILAANPSADPQLVTDGVLGAFTLAVISCVVAGVLISSPIWLYQVWAFIAPGLLKKEKKYALSFLGAAVPLFLGGCALGYTILPVGIAVMLGFTPQGMEIINLLEMSRFLSFELRIIAVFGFSFLLPVVIVAMNLMGVVRGHQLGKYRKIVVFASFVFAAMATPSVDPFSMLSLAVPITALYLISEVICRMLDKRKGISAEEEEQFSIDLDDGK